MTTREDRIAAYIHGLFCQAPLNGWDDAAVAAGLLAIADDRHLLTLGEVERMIGRHQATITRWITKPADARRTKRHVDPPPVAYWTSAGPMFDRAEVEAWMAENSEHCRVQ